MPPVDQASLPEPARLVDEIPVARAAWPAPIAPPPAKDEGEDEATPITVPPGVLRGWAWSLGIHAALLILLGFWVFSAPPREVRTIDTALGGEVQGDPFGVEGGLTIEMGGISPPPLPPVDKAPDPTASLTNAPLDTAVLDGLHRLTRSSVAPAPEDQPTDKPGRGGGAGGDGFGLARFGSPDGTLTERIRGVVVKVGDPQFTLLWDTQADLDLHVTEPGGAEIYWVERGQLSPAGGEIDVDNLTGFGPENISWFQRGDEGQKGALGAGPPGEYQWYVHYYGGMKVAGQDVPTRWKVRVKHAGTVKVYEGTLRRGGSGARSTRSESSPRAVPPRRPPSRPRPGRSPDVSPHRAESSQRIRRAAGSVSRLTSQSLPPG